MIYSHGTAPKAQPEGRYQVNILHIPKGQVSNMLIFLLVRFPKANRFDLIL